MICPLKNRGSTREKLKILGCRDKKEGVFIKNVLFERENRVKG